MILNILLTLFFVLLNGFFVAAEFAIVKVRISQLELRIREGSTLARIAKHLVKHLDEYLSATQLGITLASLGLGWIGESVVSEIILDIMVFLGISISPDLAHSIALPVAFATITFLHIIFGELAPKSMAIQRSEQVSLAISLPLRIFYFIFRPFIWTLNTLANRIIKLIGFDPVYQEQELHSPDELRYLLEESTRSGLIDTSEHQLLENVFEFAETPVKQIMVPHNKIIAVDITMDVVSIMDMFIEEGVSRMPVYNDNIDNISGVIYAKDLISMMIHKDLIILKDIIRPPYFVQENEKIDVLLRRLQREKIHLAVVLDEFGGTAGLVTLEDILEEIVGEIQDEYDEEQPFVVSLSENEFSVDAAAAIDDANDYLPVPLPESEDYETVGGLIMHEVGRIPEAHEIIQLDNYECKIMERAQRNIELVKLTLLENEEEGEF